MLEKKLNDLDNLNNLADKAISDDELEQVSGGLDVAFCTCGGMAFSNGSQWVCQSCGRKW